MYLEWHLVDSVASYLGETFDQQNFAFFGKVLQGSKEMKPRWKRVIATMNSAIGELIGAITGIVAYNLFSPVEPPLFSYNLFSCNIFSCNLFSCNLSSLITAPLITSALVTASLIPSSLIPSRLLL